MRRVYNGLTLHGTDAEQLAHRAATSWQRTHTRLNHHDREDLHAYLVATSWELSQRYDPTHHQPGHKQPPTFDQYAFSLLVLRADDWLRQTEGRTTWKFGDGRTHERPPRQHPLSLDAPTKLSPGAPTGDDDDPLAATISDSQSHDPPTLDPDGTRRLLTETVRHQNRDHRILRQAAAAHTHERAPRTRAAA